jgi:hypothetical protein
MGARGGRQDLRVTDRERAQRDSVASLSAFDATIAGHAVMST